ncbi:uncharacterized protein LOC110024705 [Phalaenopsis equestris]|uniref:uncharacterized protein LOC110024705 n=1 Tax=Phalaenopsis equestris TaxID=78828 RepID=UPI0009E59DC0|nr:uncharacterized protein LOC110024705 [Phalaenopsis equestris]
MSTISILSKPQAKLCQWRRMIRRRMEMLMLIMKKHTLWKNKRIWRNLAKIVKAAQCCARQLNTSDDPYSGEIIEKTESWCQGQARGFPIHFYFMCKRQRKLKPDTMPKNLATLTWKSNATI